MPASFTPPAGFALLDPFPVQAVQTNNSFFVTNWVYWKIAGASEPSSYEFTHSSGYNTQLTCVITQETSTAVAPTATALPRVNGSPGNSETAQFTGLTTVYDSTLIVEFTQVWDATGSLLPPGGTTPTFVEVLDSADSSIVYVSAGVLATAGATGDKTQTSGSAPFSPNAWCGILVGLAPLESSPVAYYPTRFIT